MLITVVLALALFTGQTTPRTARAYFDELYAAGGLDRMADEYVCFDEDTANENFFIFAQSKTLREGMMQTGKFEKLSKTQKDRLKKDWLVVHGYAKGIPFDAEEYYDKDGNSWISETHKLNANNLVRVRITINWQTLRYKRAVEMLKPGLTFQGEVAHWGKCEAVKSDVRQTANP